MEANLKKIPENLKAKGNKLGTLHDMPHLDEIFEETWEEHKEESEKFAKDVIAKQEKRYREKEDAWFEYGIDDYATVEEAMEAAWKVKQ